MLVHSWLFGVLLFSLILDFGHWDILSLNIAHFGSLQVILNRALSWVADAILMWRPLIGY